jgi:hypothetical protein
VESLSIYFPDKTLSKFEKLSAEFRVGFIRPAL